MPFLAAFIFALTGLVALAAHAQTPSTASAGTASVVYTPCAPAAALR